MIPAYDLPMDPDIGLYPLRARPEGVPVRRLVFATEAEANAALEMLAFVVEDDWDQMAYAAPPRWQEGEGWVLRFTTPTTERPNDVTS